MPHFGSVFTGKYLASPDLGKLEVTVKIARVVGEVVEDEKKGSRKRWIVYFDGKEKGLLLNRTNATIISKIVGSKMTEDWTGHSITIAVRDVRFGGDLVEGIRVIGSPELDKPMTVTLKFPKKRPEDIHLQPTGKKDKVQAKDQPPPPVEVKP